jgi:hypothetical protein
LLAGGLLDAALALTLALALASEAVSYPPVTLPAVALRAVLQGLACYDLHRYRQAIPWISLSVAATGMVLVWEAGAAPRAALFGAVGLVQLGTWRTARR